ncbi:MAG TPA: homocysteine S-methyltransferase family protein [Bryobacteraceae bacterium]|nr:homocysteine S-methyltransferase family protein [Bryobacteraceae bacterium]
MPQYRSGLPQLGGQPFLTDGGIETTLIFQEGIELPDFAAFGLLKQESGATALRKYFRAYAAIASRFNTGLILEAATWRASADWGDRAGYSSVALAEANRAAIALIDEIRKEMAHGQPVVLSGCVGPRGDGYVPSDAMTADDAAAYHRAQVETFAGTAADMVCAITMNYTQEAIGVARAAQRAGMPVAISFTVETDGNLPTGQPLGAAILEVDAATAGYPSYYMLNCAHPSHFQRALSGEEWTARIRGLRANASRKSHAELNESTDLDIGDPEELGSLYAKMRQDGLPHLNVMGGCCGTDHRHVERIAEACVHLIRGAL